MEQEGLKDLTELITEIIHEEAVVDWVDKNTPALQNGCGERVS